MSATNGAHDPSDLRPSDATQTSSNPRSERPRMQLPDGEVKGYRAVWDPELNPEHKKSIKAQKEKKEKGKPLPASMKKFEVRKQFHHPPSSRNMLQTQEIGKKTALYPFADTG
jgi:histone-lysine N-methyltransferase SETD1